MPKENKPSHVSVIRRKHDTDTKFHFKFKKKKNTSTFGSIIAAAQHRKMKKSWNELPYAKETIPTGTAAVEREEPPPHSQGGMGWASNGTAFDIVLTNEGKWKQTFCPISQYCTGASHCATTKYDQEGENNWETINELYSCKGILISRKRWHT